MQQKAFTIVELLIVIVVIAILAAITAIAYNGIQQRTRDSQRMTDLRTMQKVVEAYYAVNGSYPLPGRGSGTWTGACSGYGGMSEFITGVIPDFTNKLPTDPLPVGNGGCYLYRSDGANYMILAHTTVESICGGDPGNACNPANVRSFDRPNFNQATFAVYSPGGSTW